MDDVVERLRSNEPLPICPFDKRSPEYWTTPNDKPCKFCGGLPEGPDKCTGADMRIMGEAADLITRLSADLEEARKALEPFARLHDALPVTGRLFLELLVCPEGDEPPEGVRHYGQAIRAARAAIRKEGERT